MSKLRNCNFIASLRSEHKEVMTKITNNKYDLATRDLDEGERKIFEKLVQYQEWTADKILELAGYNAKKFRKEENIEL